MTLLLPLLAVVQANPPLDREVVLTREDDPTRSAFILQVDPDRSPLLIASTTALDSASTTHFVRLDTDDQVVKLKGGATPRTSAVCAPGSNPLASVPVGRRLSKEALELASAEPQLLEHVWVVAAGEDGTWLHPATVETVDRAVMTYVMQKPVPLRSAAGAPVVDVLGRVVGVHDSVRAAEDGRIVGAGCSLTGLRTAVEGH